MIKVAFCDDDLSVLNEISVLLDQYRVDRNKEITYIYKLHFWNNQLLGFSTVLSRPH